MTSSLPTASCAFCGALAHVGGMCPRVEEIRYYPNGSLRWVRLREIKYEVSVDKLPPFPHEDGDTTVIGPECFIAFDDQLGYAVISYQGENFVPQGELQEVEARAESYRVALEEIGGGDYRGDLPMEVRRAREALRG